MSTPQPSPLPAPILRKPAKLSMSCVQQAGIRLWYLDKEHLAFDRFPPHE